MIYMQLSKLIGAQTLLSIKLIYTKANLNEVEFKDGFTRDVTNIGHYGTGNLEIRFNDVKQLEEVQKFIRISYELN